MQALILIPLFLSLINAAPTFSNTTVSNTTAPNTSLIQSLLLAPTAKDRLNLLPNPSDHVFDFNSPPPGTTTTGKGGHTVRADREGFPALIGTGVSMTLGFLGPCGFNTPHTHPRSSEINVVVKGSLVAEFQLENGAPNIINTVKTNQVTVFPQGALHTEFNPDCEDAVFVAGFASEDPGVQQAAQTLLGFEDDIVEAALGSLSGQDLEKWRAMVPANVALGVESCLKKCGIQKK